MNLRLKKLKIMLKMKSVPTLFVSVGTVKIGAYVRYNGIFKIELAHPGQEIQGM